jgi:hypothetical protein
MAGEVLFAGYGRTVPISIGAKKMKTKYGIKRRITNN